MKVFGEWNKGWQAIAAEMTDYTKRSFEEGTATFEKLLSAKSVEQAIEIQTGFAKRAYDGYMHQMSKIGGMYAELAKEAYKPVEKALRARAEARATNRVAATPSKRGRAQPTKARARSIAPGPFFVAIAVLITQAPCVQRARRSAARGLRWCGPLSLQWR